MIKQCCNLIRLEYFDLSLFKLNFARYGVCTGKEGIVKSYILDSACSKKVITFSDVTSKPYFGKIEYLFANFRAVNNLSRNSTSVNYFGFLEFCPKFYKKLMYRLWEKLAKNVRMDSLTNKGEFQRTRTCERMSVKDRLYTKHPEVVTTKRKYEKRTKFEKWI